MGRRGHPAEFRRKVLDLVESGRPVADVAKALGISDQTNYAWRRLRAEGCAGRMRSSRRRRTTRAAPSAPSVPAWPEVR
jgi:transposase-like protein